MNKPIPKDIFDCLKEVLDYNLHEEYQGFIEDPSSKHIYIKAVIADSWLRAHYDHFEDDEYGIYDAAYETVHNIVGDVLDPRVCDELREALETHQRTIVAIDEDRRREEAYDARKQALADMAEDVQ